MNSNELREMQRKLERKFEQRKLKRFAYTVLFYAAVFFGIFYWQDQLVGETIWDVLGVIMVCVILSIISVVINSIIFYQLFRIDQGEKETLDFLKRRVEVKEKTNN